MGNGKVCVCVGVRRMEERVKINKYLKQKIQEVAKQVRYSGNKEVNIVNQFQEK